jgi:hypothetical protein
MSTRIYISEQEVDILRMILKTEKASKTRYCAWNVSVLKPDISMGT